ncbi:hypothetical protein B0H13DRAFT_2369160 [Mycena leptocephala]|nr:hypothetical protein B0H13DRAFT_2369160 [Mycena leptocephala]
MLRSQILCSCVPAPLSYFSAYTFALPFARPTLAAIPMFPARPRPLALSNVSRMPACIPAFPLSFPHAHARLHFHRLLMPARICTAQHATVRFLHARSPLRSLFPACPFAAARFPHTHARSHLHCTTHRRARCFPHARSPHCALVSPRALPPPPRASSSTSHFLLCLALPLCLASPPPRLAPLRLTGEAEPGAERDKNWL